MDVKQHIAQAHALGLHDDGYFHPECTICLTESAACYRAECHQILDGMGAELTEFDRWFDAIIEVDRAGLTMQEEPVTLLAEFLGIDLRDGNHNPAWQRIESVARPLRIKRLARTQHMSHDDQQVIDAIVEAEAAMNDALFLAASKGILTRLDTGTSAIRHQVSQNWVKVAMWRNVNLRE